MPLKNVSALLVSASENHWSLTSGRVQVPYKWIETKGLTSKATCEARGAPHYLPHGLWSTQTWTVVVCSYDSYWKWIIESRIVVACQTCQTGAIISPPHDYCSQAALNLLKRVSVCPIQQLKTCARTHRLRPKNHDGWSLLLVERILKWRCAMS